MKFFYSKGDKINIACEMEYVQLHNWIKVTDTNGDKDVTVNNGLWPLYLQDPTTWKLKEKNLKKYCTALIHTL